MLNSIFFDKIRRGLKKPPDVIIERLFFELKLFTSKYTIPIWVNTFTDKRFLKKVKYRSIKETWYEISNKSFFINPFLVNSEIYKREFISEYNLILDKANLAFENKISLLGTGLIELGDHIDWHKDYKSGIRWLPRFITEINYSNPYDESDVKIPWEISRLQWLIPLAQAYVLTNDEKYAAKVKDVIQSWIKNNPYARSVNWACTMEVALRIFTLTFFFHVFKNSNTWNDLNFQSNLLKTIWLHGKFTEEFIEKSDVNGNHFTADAAALVVAGLFFNSGDDSKRWHEKGWKYLNDELPKQVFSDGVNYEASLPYHRLVLELFFYPAYYRQIVGFDVSTTYKEVLNKMAFFVACSTNPENTVPVWGDADDARALPFSFTNINDHRYLLGLIGIAFNFQKIKEFFSGPVTELIWFFGFDRAKELSSIDTNISNIPSTAFSEGGFFILRDRRNYVFIDCGPLGLAGRGGHGHNDILSFEAYLQGQPLIVDSGSYQYTGSYIERNNFRSTSYHNTPQIDNIEINRFIRWDYLWNLINDAQPSQLVWDISMERSIFKGSHSGYKKIDESIEIERLFILDHLSDTVFIKDFFIINENHSISIPYHFHPDVILEQTSESEVSCFIRGQKFYFVVISDSLFQLSILPSRVSFSYGTFQPSNKVILTLAENRNPEIIVSISPIKRNRFDIESYINNTQKD